MGHPNSGQKYKAFDTQCFLPTNAAGNEVCSLLTRAAEQRILFRVTTSDRSYKDDHIEAHGVDLKTEATGE